VDGRWTTFAVDDLGRRILVTEPNGIQTRTTYDGWGRVRTVTRLAKGSVGPVTVDYRHAPDGTWVTETTTADGHSLSTRTEFDGWGRAVKVTFPDGSTRQTWFDGFGQMVRQTPVLKPHQAAYGDMAWVYDAQGRLCEKRDRVQGAGTGRVLAKVQVQPTWNGEGIITTVHDAEGGGHTTLTDVLGQTVVTTDPLGQVVSYYHDRNGYLLRTVQGNQARTHIRNDLGWLLSETGPEEGTTVFSDFTSDGIPLAMTRIGHSGTSNAQVRIIPDAWLRPSEIRASSPDGDVVRRMTYDPGTRLLSKIVDSQPYGTLTESFGYDDLDRLAVKTTSDGLHAFPVSRKLYDSGTIRALCFPAKSSSTVLTSLDDLSRPQTVTLDGSTRGQMFYDDMGTGTGFTETLALGNGACTTYAWDKDQLACVTHKFGRIGADLENASQGLAYNRQENHLGWSRGGLLLWRGPDPTHATGPDGFPVNNDLFAYDPLGRLRQAKVHGIHLGESVLQNFGYDAFGNRSRSDFKYEQGEGGKQPDEVGAWQGIPDPTTNQLPGTLQGPAGPLTTGAVYDDYGRLTSILAVPNQSGRHSVSWDFDGAFRVKREVLDGLETTYLLDSEGLRFRSNNPDGSATYTVHGFSREPLSVFVLRPG
jgi:YD repeat-containing protein